MTALLVPHLGGSDLSSPVAVEKAPVQISCDRFSTRDPAEAHHLLATAYAEHALSLRGDRSAFSFALARASTPELSISRVRHNLGARASWQPLEGLLVVRLRTGVLEFSGSHEQVQLRAGDVALTPEGEFSTRWTDMAVESFLIPRQVLAVAAHSGGGARQVPRFQRLVPRSSTRASYLHQVLDLCRTSMIGAAPAAASPLVHDALLRLLAGTVLDSFAHTPAPDTESRSVGASPSSAPGTVRRAVAHIEAHAAQPLDVADIAAAAGTSVRALQAAFARHLECTPIAYLRQVRLQRAHTDLQAASAEEGSTVTSIAHRWGFAKPSRFAAEYRAAFGVSPSQTLRS